MLANEIDIVKLLYIQRIGQFMAKLLLKRHQRALVTNFDTWSLDSLKEKKYSAVGDSETLLQPTIQEDGIINNMLVGLGDFQDLTED